MQEITAEIDRITFRSEDAGWTVAKAMDLKRGQLFVVTGYFPNIRSGETLLLIGDWVNHPQYGRQFQVDRSVPIKPSTEEGIKKYLASGIIKGIGEKTAEKIVATFGTETIDILDHTPERLMLVPKLGKKKLREIVEGWKKQKQDADLNMFLNQYGLGGRMAQRIVSAYGDETISVVSKDPYRLATEINGIGFILADQLAARLGIPSNDPLRFRAAVLYQLDQAEDKGHCFLKRDQIAYGLLETLKLDQNEVFEKAEDALNDLVREGAVKFVKNELSDVFYKNDLYYIEQRVAEEVAKRAGVRVNVDLSRVERWLSRYLQASGLGLSSDQKEALLFAVQFKFFILTGGPGTGKTTAANAIIKIFKSMGKTCVLAAPTGRAAQRMSEVTHEQAKTIHRLLEWNPGTCYFNRGEENPIEADVVIIDETSMIDIRLMHALIRAVSEDTQLILIGDADQLPSVGPGNVLRDLIESKQVSVKKLREVFRQAAKSKIIQAAHQINSGLLPVFDEPGKTDFWFIEIEEPERIQQVIYDLVVTKLPEVYHIDPMKDIQVLTPIHRGILGTVQLNQDLQGLLNPIKDIKEEGFRPNDKVIQMVNNYDLGVYNGDIGFVKLVGVEKNGILVSFGKREVLYKEDQIFELQLAYAITIHKSQGSEFPVVVLPVSMQHYIMLQRNLIYTGLTRAKRVAVFVGTKKALGFAVRNENPLLRQTMLQDRVIRMIRGVTWIRAE